MIGRPTPGPKNDDCTPGIRDTVSPRVGLRRSSSAGPARTAVGRINSAPGSESGRAVTTMASSGVARARGELSGRVCACAAVAASASEIAIERRRGFGIGGSSTVDIRYRVTLNSVTGLAVLAPRVSGFGKCPAVGRRSGFDPVPRQSGRCRLHQLGCVGAVTLSALTTMSRSSSGSGVKDPLERCSSETGCCLRGGVQGADLCAESIRRTQGSCGHGVGGEGDGRRGWFPCRLSVATLCRSYV